MAITGIPSEGGTIKKADMRSERLTLERGMLDEAREEISAGCGIDDDSLDAWLDRIVSGDPVAIPKLSPTPRIR